MTYTITQIIAGLTKVLTGAQFFVTPTGDLAMRLDGEVVDSLMAKRNFRKHTRLELTGV